MRRSIMFSAFSFSGVLSLAVLFGYWIQSATLVQIVPGWVPMAFNAALGFALTSLALLALATGRRGISIGLSFLVMLLSCITLLEYAFKLPFSIDALAGNFVVVETAHPGRMAPQTAICFIFCCLAALNFCFGKQGFNRQLFGTMCGMIVMLLGLLGMLGYLFHVESLYGWGYFPRMAIHTTAGFIGLGLGILAYSFQVGTAGEISLEMIRRQLLCYSIAGTLFIGLFSSNAGLLPSFSYLEASSRNSIADDAVNKSSIVAEWARGLQGVVKQLSSRSLVQRMYGRYLAGDMSAEALQERVAGNLKDALLATTEILGICRVNDTVCAVSAGMPLSDTMIADAKNSNTFFTGPYQDADEIYFVAKNITTQIGIGEVTDLYLVDSKPLVAALAMGKDVGQSEKLFVAVPQPGGRKLLRTDAAIGRFRIVSEYDEALKTVLQDPQLDALGSFQTDVSVKDGALLGYATVPALKWIVLNEVDPDLIYAGTLRWMSTALVLVGLISTLGALGMFLLLRPLQRQMFIHANALEEKIQEKTKEVQRTSEFKSQFLANMSHEIRTPLTAILGFADQLRDPDISPSAASDSLHAIARNGTHLLNLINDILDLSKIEAGKMVIEQIECQPIEIVREVIVLMEPRATEKNLALHLNLVWPLPSKIISDPTRFKQILLNLLSNAVKFTENGFVRIKIEFQHARRILQVAVEDTGIGIHDEQLVHLFTAFNQADASTTRRFGGTGLGLAITNELAQILSGKLRVESKVGVGSQFIVEFPVGEIEFPLMHGEPVRATAQGRPVVQTAVPKLAGSILLVEDSEDIRAMVSYFIKKTGAQLQCAENGVEAIEAITKQPFDLVLMDMQMPIMDGYTATRKLRADRYSRPIVGLTANTINEGLQKCMEAGCNDAMAKPFDREHFYRMLSQYLPLEGSPKAATPPVDTIRDFDAHELALRDGFIKRLPVSLEQIRNSLSAGEWAKVGDEAHRLAGAGLFGLKDISAAAKELEKAARSTVPGAVAEQVSKLSAVCATYANAK